MGPPSEDDESPRKWTIERWLLVGTFVMTALAFTFTMGMNWQRITKLEAQQDADSQIYLRSDVYAADQQGLKDSIDRLTRALDRIERRQPQVAPDRTFER